VPFADLFGSCSSPRKPLRPLPGGTDQWVRGSKKQTRGRSFEIRDPPTLRCEGLFLARISQGRSSEATEAVQRLFGETPSGCDFTNLMQNRFVTRPAPTTVGGPRCQRRDVAFLAWLISGNWSMKASTTLSQVQGAFRRSYPGLDDLMLFSSKATFPCAYAHRTAHTRTFARVLLAVSSTRSGRASIPRRNISHTIVRQGPFCSSEYPFYSILHTALPPLNVP